MGKYFCFLTLFGFMIVVFGAGATLAGTDAIGKNTITKIELDGNWVYHWGDFEFDAQGNPAGIHDAAAWKPYTDRRDMRRGSHTVMWLRRRLPGQAVPTPAIFVPSYTSYQAFDVYLDERLIFSFGQAYSSFRLKHTCLKWHLIPLPADFPGKEIAMRFYSEHPFHIGLIEALYIGGYNHLIARFVFRDIDLTILGILFSIIGGLGYLFLGKIYRWRNAALLSFATLATFSGLYLFTAESKFSQLFFDRVFVLSYLGSVSHFLFMAGIWGFLASLP